MVELQGEWVPDESHEHRANITWEQTTIEELRERFSDYQRTQAFPHWNAEGPANVYGLIDQFADAAMGQPGVPFAFRAGGRPMLPIIIKHEDGEFWMGVNDNSESFASVTGYEGEGDGLFSYPAPEGGGSPREVTESLLESKPVGKTQASIMKALETGQSVSGKNPWIDLTDLATMVSRVSGHHGTHLAQVMNSAETLAKKRILQRRKTKGHGDQYRLAESTDDLIENLIQSRRRITTVEADRIAEALLS